MLETEKLESQIQKSDYKILIVDDVDDSFKRANINYFLETNACFNTIFLT